MDQAIAQKLTHAVSTSQRPLAEIAAELNITREMALLGLLALGWRLQSSGVWAAPDE